MFILELIFDFITEFLPELIQEHYSGLIDKRVKNKAARFLLKAVLFIACVLLTVIISFILLGFLIGLALKLIGFILL